MRRDPLLLTLLVMAAAYFLLYYLTDPVRPAGVFPGMFGFRDTAMYPQGWFGYYDQGAYLRLSHTLSGLHFHELFSTYSYGVGYPLVAVPALWLGFNNDPYVFFNFFAFVFAIYAIYTVAKKMISPFAAFLAGFGLLFATPLIAYVDIPWNSTVCLVVMSVILLTLPMKKVGRWHIVLLGVLVGWAFAARYIDVLFLGALALAAIYRGSFKALVKPVVYMAIGTLIVVLPVLFSHYKIFGSPFKTPYVNHLGIGGVDGSDQGAKAYNIKRVPRAGLALFVSPKLAGSTDGDRGLLINFFWALAAIPGVVILMRKKENRMFFGVLLGVGFAALIFYLSFRASTPGSLKYGWLHYIKMFWPCLVLMAVAYFNQLYQKSLKLFSAKPKKQKV